ncbi:hypothetical protein L2E82_49216 [Cichorium intybus]|uniref:Uncharacterized protein n=1 Tax=Cichorium intybus TaxID=13427 RepID=A0ACB8Z0B4_CICIN|nr:hypothetical protein L2E82_49216 [Cichorium intybus]
MKEKWVTAAMTNDAVVAELLIRMKQSSSLDSSATDTALLPTVRWGHRKSRSKPSAIATTTTNAATASGLRKEHLSGSPTTPLYWSSGGGASTSDGYDESSRPSDLSSGGRSTKGGLGNEGATTSSYKKSRKRKSFAELKEEEDFLLKEKLHLNRELESMRLTMNKQIATSQNLKNFKVNFNQNPKIEIEKNPKMIEDEQEKGFFLPDLNMAPEVEEL